MQNSPCVSSRILVVFFRFGNESFLLESKPEMSCLLENICPCNGRFCRWICSAFARNRHSLDPPSAEHQGVLRAGGTEQVRAQRFQNSTCIKVAVSWGGGRLGIGGESFCLEQGTRPPLEDAL